MASQTPLAGDDLIIEMGRRIVRKRQIEQQMPGIQRQLKDAQSNVTSLSSEHSQLNADLPAMRTALLEGSTWSPVPAAGQSAPAAQSSGSLTSNSNQASA